MKQKKIFFEKKKNQNGRLKKTEFSTITDFNATGISSSNPVTLTRDAILLLAQFKPTFHFKVEPFLIHFAVIKADVQSIKILTYGQQLLKK